MKTGTSTVDGTERASWIARPGWRTPLAALGSLRAAAAILVLFGAGVVATYVTGTSSPLWLAVPLLLFAVNLGCAVLANAVFRAQTALLVFHLALIAIVLLAAAGRMTYLKGQLELSTGETYSGVLSQVEAGPWHVSALDRARFTSHGFTIAYHPGIKRDRTENTVEWTDGGGRRQRAVIGDNLPLVLAGYRFYTTPNKGFAPLFSWHPARGAVQRGTIHLPSYPMNEYRQALEWTVPGTDLKLWTLLNFDEVLLDPARPSQFRLPGEHTLVVRIGEQRHELQPGNRIVLPEGVLAYEGLTTWMGYNVFYDWTLPWLLAACLLAVASLAGHFWKKFAAQPWRDA
jgi:cytochrome c biogenesis protein